MASLSNVKFNRIFNLERGHKGQFAWKQRILKWRPFWNKVYALVFFYHIINPLLTKLARSITHIECAAFVLILQMVKRSCLPF